MNINSKKKFSLILILIIGLAAFSVHADNTPTTKEEAKEASDELLLAESKTILANINQLTQQSSELKEVATEIPDFDRLLFITLLISIEKELSSELDRLINIQQKLDNSIYGGTIFT